ncbi:hypothetical protein VKT23_019204 [Stygiomarasmius scandens]|uniref:Uncharacterized protein n=1 Tax=Marasmiellus scandens TaxID=2682957 RepID=A0ABR1IM89_9AGAR
MSTSNNLDLQPEHFLRNRDETRAYNYLALDVFMNLLLVGALTYGDGAVGCLSSLTREFVTSPTKQEIPYPPFGSTRDLYRRADGLYGEDDPIQHPQPYNPRFPYLPCIPKQPHKPTHPYYEHRFIWTQIQKHHLDFTTQGAARGEGVLNSICAGRLDAAIASVENRLKTWKLTHGEENHLPVVELLMSW